MDLFAFFSETDTFGNVVLEALASGVPAVVTDKGGPKFIVEHERCGFVCGSDEEFIASGAAPDLQRFAAARHGRRRPPARRARLLGRRLCRVYETYRRELPEVREAAKPARFRER